MATYIMYVPGLYAFVFTQHECTVATLYYLQVSSYIHDISTCLPHVQYIKYIIIYIYECAYMHTCVPTPRTLHVHVFLVYFFFFIFKINLFLKKM